MGNKIQSDFEHIFFWAAEQQHILHDWRDILQGQQHTLHQIQPGRDSAGEQSCWPGQVPAKLHLSKISAIWTILVTRLYRREERG